MTTKRIFKALLFIVLVVISSTSFAQTKRLKVEIENISLKAPEYWQAKKITDENGFTIRLSNEQNPSHIVLNCIKHTTNLEATIVNAASQKSLLNGFEYMIIEKVHSRKLKDYNAKFLEYTNSPLRDYYRGGFWAFIDRGYTYVVDYYSADLPEQREEVNKIVTSIKVLAPESRPNFFVVEKEYSPENVIVAEPEKIDTTAENITSDTAAKPAKHFLFFKKKAKTEKVSQEPQPEKPQPVVTEAKPKHKGFLSIFKKKEKE